MNVHRELMYPLRVRREIHRADVVSYRLPDSWVEAREKAGSLPFDDTRTIGEVFDRASAKLSHSISRDKHKLRGVPCFRGTRIPVYQICGMVAEGIPLKKVASTLCISEQQVRTALRFASIILEQ